MMKKISSQEYVERFLPMGAFILVERHKLPEKTASGIILDTNARSKHVKFAMTGTVVAKSPFTAFENEMDQYMMDKIQLGDTVGFSATTPILSPAPPDFSFDNEDQFYTLHIGDLLCMVADSKEDASVLRDKF